MRLVRIPVLAAALALLLAACGGGNGDGTGDTATTQAGTETTQAGTDTSSPPAGAAEGIHTADTDLGTVLVDPDGFTLYVFTNDVDGESTCYDACADLWPPVAADTAVGADLDAAMFGSTARTDGSEQLTVNGMPVYLYTPDINPGDTTGQNVGGVWFVLDASGAIVGGPEAAASTTTNPYDY